MIKGLLILTALLGMVMYALIVATATPNDRDEYEAYMRYKERKHGRVDMEEWIKKSDAIDAINKNHYRLEGHGLTEELLLEQIRSIPSVQVPPKPKDDVVGYRWVLKWDLKELWTGLR